LHVNPASAFPFDYKKIPSSNFSRKKLGDYARFAKSFMADGDKPFFLSVNYPDPHRPFIRQIKGIPKNPLSADDVKPLAYFGMDTPELRNQTADYYNCMSRLDTLIGDLLEELSQSGKQKNTLIIYMGDHGADLLRGKRTSYEGGVRVPLIMQWSGREGFGKSVRTELVSTLDLMPTILSAANAALPKGLAGKSLIPMLQGQVKGWREHLFTEFNLHSAHNFYPQRTIRGERFKLIQNLQPGVLNPGYDFTINRFFDGLQKTITENNNVRDAYSLMRRPPAFELYDLNNDPFEFRNLADDNKFSSQLQSLKNKLAEWRRETNDPFLDPKNILQLQTEIKASIRDGKPDKKHLKLNYWNYFFE
jgi:N-sulfoglucosamine sulfohydrolase